MPKVLKSLWQYIAEAITKNYLITVAITSYTQAKYQTANLPFGLGKTTLAMELAYILCGGKWEDIVNNTTDPKVWEKVHKIMCYDPYALGELLEPGRERLPCAIYDDVQATAPASQSVPTAIRKLANFISTERPECALIMFTTPNLNYMAAPLRKLINFEIIISERGYFETHKISYFKDFSRPLQDRMHFDYVQEIPQKEPFPALPDYEQQWYDTWRIEHKRQLYPSMMKELKVYTKLRKWEESGSEQALTSVTGKVIRAANGYAIRISDDVGARLHMKDVEMAITATN